MRVLLAAILCVLTISAARAETQNPRPVPPGLKQIMAEGAARAIGSSHRGERWTLTCDDVRAIVERVGEAYAIAAAQAYGAGEAQIAVARQCLTKKTNK